MSLAILYKDRVTIQVRTATQTSMGETVVWRPVEKRYALVTPLDAKARAVYQQLQSEVTHEVKFRGSVTLNLDNNRLLWKAKTLEPVMPTEEKGNSTVVMVREI